MTSLIHRAARSFARRTFSFWEKFGLHVTYTHFYEPIPNTGELNDALWRNMSELPGIEMNDESQCDLLHSLSAHCKEPWEALAKDGASQSGKFSLGNGYFESVDAEILHGLIHYFKPRRIIEIGAGFSTLLAEQAIHEIRNDDSSFTCEHIAIDPYPQPFLRGTANGLSVVQQEVQAVPLDTFSKLDRNDILFIDSSHVLKIGSDVRYEYLEILPRLRPGVLVHFHDIFFPAEYPKEWVLNDHRFWNEQYLLQAFLTFNDQFEVLWAGSYMRLKHPDLLARAIPSFNHASTEPKSFWIRRKD